jgi:DNA-binding NarL/FixJ family response regulator
VIADDSGLLRDGITSLLTAAGMQVVGAVADADALVALVEDTAPDAAVVDIRMPPTYTHEGARAAAQLRARHRTLAILLLSQSLESRYVADLARESPQHLGYLLKDTVVDAGVLVNALRTIVAGGTVLDPEVVAHLLGRQSLADQLARLTPREREVIDLMAQGLSNAAIANRVVLDTKTVETHIARIFTKLDLPPSRDDNRRVRAVLTWLRA